MFCANFDRSTWVLANRIIKADLTGRDRIKLVYWKATTARGCNLNVRVCSLKLPRIFAELKNRIMATLVATSTESTSFPKINGLYVVDGNVFGLVKRVLSLITVSKLGIGSASTDILLKACFRCTLKTWYSNSGMSKNGSAWRGGII